MADPSILDPRMEFLGKGSHGDAGTPILTDLRERDGTGTSPEVRKVFRDRSIWGRQASLRLGEAAERIGIADEERNLPSENKREIMPSGPETVIDLHTHLFNARYLPFKGILKENGVPGWLAGPAERLFTLLIGKADFVTGPHRAVIDGVGEDDSLEPLAHLLATTASRAMAERVVTKELITFEGRRSARAAAGQAALRSDEFYAVLEEIEELAWPGAPADFARRQFDELADLIDQLEGARGLTDLDTLDQVGDWVSRRFCGALLWFLEMLLSTIRGDPSGTALDYVKFFLLMLSEESTLREALFSGFDGEQNVGLVAHMMRNMQKAYGNKRPHYRFFKRKNKRMAVVAEGGGGKLVGFVAFDPRRSGGLRIVKYALRRGDCGVKIYPAMEDPAFGIGTQHQARLRALFAHCSRERIPILTHCSPVGLEVSEGSEVLYDPDFWLGVLDENRDLKLCFGHAGGGGGANLDPETGSEVPYFGWCSETDEEWSDDHHFARKVVEHRCRFPNVYCDFSYFGAIVKDRENAINFKRNLIAALGGPNGDLHFGKKIMYGSDWHMPKMAEHAAEYLAFWRELFDDPQIALYRDAFFFSNAMRFLGFEGMVQRHEWGSASALSASRGVSVQGL